MINIILFIKNGYDKEIAKNKYEDNEVDYIILKDFIVPNHYIGKEKNNKN